MSHLPEFIEELLHGTGCTCPGHRCRVTELLLSVETSIAHLCQPPVSGPLMDPATNH